MGEITKATRNDKNTTKSTTTSTEIEMKTENINKIQTYLNNTKHFWFINTYTQYIVHILGKAYQILAKFYDVFSICLDKLSYMLDK